jgi:hypothetical protein
MSGAGRDPFEPPDIFDQSLIDGTACRSVSTWLPCMIIAINVPTGILSAFCSRRLKSAALLLQLGSTLCAS